MTRSVDPRRRAVHPPFPPSGLPDGRGGVAPGLVTGTCRAEKIAGRPGRGRPYRTDQGRDHSWTPMTGWRTARTATARCGRACGDHRSSTGSRSGSRYQPIRSAPGRFMPGAPACSRSVTFSSLTASFCSVAASHCCPAPSSCQIARQRPCSPRNAGSCAAAGWQECSVAEDGRSAAPRPGSSP
jgi:hypothetical protein